MIFPYRTHISFNKINNLEMTTFDTNILNKRLKPYDFYYSIKDEWYIFLNTEFGSYVKKRMKYIYELKLNKNSFININNVPDIKNIEDISIFIKKIS